MEEIPLIAGFLRNCVVWCLLASFGPTAVTLDEFEASSGTAVPANWLAALALLGIALLGFAITRLLRSHPSKSKP